MHEPDFSGIDPLRVPEARRRVAAIEEYLSIADPTTADMMAHAGRLGLSRWQYQRLVRAWREHRRPAMLVVGPRGRATRRYDIDPRGVEIAREIIGAAGGAAELATVAKAIEERCSELSARPPSRPTIWNYVRETRAMAGSRMGEERRIVIGRMWFHLPVSDLSGEAGTDMPTLLVAVALPERIIVAFKISIDDDRPPSVAELVADVLSERSTGGKAIPLWMEPNDRRAAADVLDGAGLARLQPHARSIQRELSRAFGGRFGPLAALYRRGLARPRTRRIVRHQEDRLEPEAAIAAITAAIEKLNATHAGAKADFDVLP